MGKDWDKFGGKPIGDGYEGDGGMKRYFRGNKPVYEAGIHYQHWTTQWATQALRVLKPGGYLLAFGGTRTHHRLVCGLEDAGFEIRDTICWLYGSGFPKSLDISKQIDKYNQVEREIIGYKKAGLGSGKTYAFTEDNYLASDRVEITVPFTEAAKEWAGWGTALKPAFEPIVVARKPLSEKNVASNVLKWGTGGLDIDGARIGIGGGGGNKMGSHYDRLGNTKAMVKFGENETGTMGRWPANVILECTCEEVIGGKHTDPDCPCRMLDEQSGERKSSHGGGRSSGHGKSIFGLGIQEGYYEQHENQYFDLGGASRFFYCAKASSRERGEGNIHPTCKPIKLMEYLVKLVSRPGATLLDPFAGSMSTALAAVALGRKCIAIEQSQEYCEMLKNRCKQIALGI